MKNHLYKAALVAALGVAGAMAAHAQNANDLMLGFTSQASGVSDDYIVDLGPLPTGGNIAANYNTDLSVSGFNSSTFNSTFGSAVGANEVFAGIVGGSTGATKNIFLSQLDNGTGSPILAGSATPNNPISANDLAAAAGLPVGLTEGAVGQTAATSFSYLIAENPTTPGADSINNFATDAGNNPMATLTSGTPLVLDLWYDTASTLHGGTLGTWAFDGTVTLGVNSGGLSAVYDEVQVVPEPSTYGIFGIGLLLLGLGHRFTRKTA
jgi:PEP-CTERM motif